jgi:hypothetical protein
MMVETLVATSGCETVVGRWEISTTNVVLQCKTALRTIPLIDYVLYRLVSHMGSIVSTITLLLVPSN